MIVAILCYFQLSPARYTLVATLWHLHHHYHLLRHHNTVDFCNHHYATSTITTSNTATTSTTTTTTFTSAAAPPRGIGYSSVSVRTISDGRAYNPIKEQHPNINGEFEGDEEAEETLDKDEPESEELGSSDDLASASGSGETYDDTAPAGG